MPDAGIKSARPKLLVEGREETSLGEGLLSLLIVETTAGLYRCEATLGNWGAKDGGIGPLYFDRKLLDFGKAFEVRLDSDALFAGRIVGLEAHFREGGARELNVLAEDGFQDLRMTRRTRFFARVSDENLFKTIADDHHLTARVEATGGQHEAIGQINQSDLAFLRERARAIGAEIWVDGKTLHVANRSRRGGSALQMAYQKTLREFSVLSDLAHQRTSVVVSGWDVAGKAPIKHEATESILSGELNGDQSGPSILQSKFGKRVESVAHTAPLTDEEVRLEAEALFRTTARRFVTGHGVADTDGRLRVGRLVDLQGLGPLYSGKYYVAEVRTFFDFQHGLRSEFLGERPGLGKAA